MDYNDIYPVRTQEMTTEALLHEATQLEGKASDILDLTEGATFEAMRYRFIRAELRNR